MPESLGRFKILRELGKGAQSQVYLAFDPQLHREVAVKVFAGRADKAETLLNEARAVSRLSHPAIIPVFEAALDEQDGNAYLVFEYVAGPTLTEVLRQQGALEPSLAVKMLLPVLDAVAYAHANGVIHRDIKPSNILIDPRGMARLMDFGVAVRQVDQTETAAQEDEDQRPAPLGTPMYMAPEYILHGQVSPQMDVFSVALVLYEMLTGLRGAQGENGLQVMKYLVNTDIALPEILAYPVDERLRAALSRALTRDPALRYAQLSDFAQALRQWSNPAPQVSGEYSSSAATGRSSDTLFDVAQAATLDGLLRRMRLKSDLPALPASVRALGNSQTNGQTNVQAGAQIDVQTGNSPSQNALTAAALLDPAITQKLLRMVNSTTYRRFGGGSVSTVSRAVQLLGLGAAQTAVTSLPLMDLNKNPVQSARVLDEMMLSLFCGTVARALSGLQGKEAEEAQVCASLARLGNMVAAMYFPEETAEIDRISQDASVEEQERAAVDVLGLSISALGVGVAKRWSLPHIVQRCMQAADLSTSGASSLALAASQATPPQPALSLPLTVPGPAQASGPGATPLAPSTRADKLTLLSALALVLAHAWMTGGWTTGEWKTGGWETGGWMPDGGVTNLAQHAGDQRSQAVQHRVFAHAQALGLSHEQLQASVALAQEAVKTQLQALEQDLRYSDVARRLQLAPPRHLLRPLDEGGMRLTRADQTAMPGLSEMLSHSPSTPSPMAFPDGLLKPLPDALPDALSDALRSTFSLGAAEPVNNGKNNCLDILAAAVQLQTNALLTSFDLDHMVLDTVTALQHAAGFRQVIFCDYQAEQHMLVGRTVVGGVLRRAQDVVHLRVAMDNPTDWVPSLFANAQDAWIPNVMEPGLAIQLPEVLHQFWVLGGLLLLPVQVQGKPLGLIYADTSPFTAPLHLSSRALSLMATLRNQLALAIRQRAFAEVR